MRDEHGRVVAAPRPSSATKASTAESLTNMASNGCQPAVVRGDEREDRVPRLGRRTAGRGVVGREQVAGLRAGMARITASKCSPSTFTPSWRPAMPATSRGLDDHRQVRGEVLHEAAQPRGCGVAHRAGTTPPAAAGSNVEGVGPLAGEAARLPRVDDRAEVRVAAVR